jgi:flagellar protein FlaJ
MIDLVQMVYNMHPQIKRDLIAAHMKISPQDFIRRSLQSSFLYAVMLSLLSLMVVARAELPLFIPLIVFVAFFYIVLMLQLKAPQVRLSRRVKLIDNDVLFTGRFLLIKLSSGRPLLNALSDTAKSPGAASLHIKEIVDEINFGTPIEVALQLSVETSPSRYFRNVVFQITNALKVGLDVTQNLETVLSEIEAEQALEIEKYGKKLSSVALFYMILGVVIPSLGMTIFMVVATLVSIQINVWIYGLMLFFIIAVNFAFIIVFRQIRPAVDI